METVTTEWISSLLLIEEGDEGKSNNGAPRGKESEREKIEKMGKVPSHCFRCNVRVCSSRTIATNRCIPHNKYSQNPQLLLCEN